MTRCADWIIDLGPDLGGKGGEIVVCATPEEVSEHLTSHTGKYLKQVLEQQQPKKWCSVGGVGGIGEGLGVVAWLDGEWGTYGTRRQSAADSLEYWCKIKRALLIDRELLHLQRNAARRRHKYIRSK